MKKIFLVISILLLATFLSSCHGALNKDPSFSEREKVIYPDKFDTTKNIEITFWSKNDSNVVQKQIYEEAINSFEKYYPNIKVKMIPYTDYKEIFKDVITNISTATTPNICITYPDHVATYLEGRSVIACLDDIMANESYGLGGSDVAFPSLKKDDIEEKFLNECLYEGSYYSLPFMRSTEACYINKTYVESLGYTIPDVLTWDYVFEVSEKAKEERKNEDSFIPLIYKSADNMMIQMLAQKNEKYSDDYGNYYLFNDTTKEILLKLGELAKKKVFSVFSVSGYPGNSFNKGNTIFAIDSTAGATWMGTDAPNVDIHQSEMTEFETVVRPIPQYDENNPKMISQGPSLCLFEKEDKNEVIASWLFMQYLLTNDVQIAYSKTEGYIPVTNSATSSPSYISYLSKSGIDNNEYYKVKIDAVKMLNDNIDNTFVTSVFSGSTSLRDASGQLIIDTVWQARRKKIVDDSFIDELFKDIESKSKLDQIVVKGSSIRPGINGEITSSVIILFSFVIISWLILGILKIKKIKRGRECI